MELYKEQKPCEKFQLIIEEHPMPEKPAEKTKHFAVALIATLLLIAIVGLAFYMKATPIKKPIEKPEPEVVSYTWTHSGIVRVTIINNGGEGWCKVTVSVITCVEPVEQDSQTLRVYLKRGESTTLQFVFDFWLDFPPDITVEGE